MAISLAQAEFGENDFLTRITAILSNPLAAEKGGLFAGRAL
jgi:hypothetical protein